MKKLIVTTLLILAVFIRFYKLGEIPNGLATDEADLAYNAYSILKTQKDVYSQKLPLFFLSLDDYKPGLVFYTTIPAIAIFGPTDFATRFAPAIFGTMTIVLFFFLAKLLYPKNPPLPYIAIILTTFAPWHIALSRAMVFYIEVIFLYLVCLVTFLSAQKAIGKPNLKKTLLLISFVSLALTLYVYYAAVIYLPFILGLLIFIYRDFVKANLKIFLIALTFLLVFSAPAFFHYSRAESRSRLNAISVLTADVTLPTSIAEIEYDKRQGFPLSELIHNRRIVFASSLLDNYFDYLNLDYLFITAKNVRYFYINNVGLFYLLELPFILFGVFALVRRRDKSDLLVAALLLIGPIPAMITLGSPFPHRALLTIVALQLFSAIGISSFILRSGNNRREVTYILLLAYGISAYFFLHQYFVHSAVEFTSESDNGAWFSTVRDANLKLNHYKGDYDKIVFSWATARLVPPIYYLLYNQVDPKTLQEKSAKWTDKPPSYRQIMGQVDNIEFRPINWEIDQNLKNTLFVGYSSEFPQSIKPIDQTHLPNGQPHFMFVETQ